MIHGRAYTLDIADWTLMDGNKSDHNSERRYFPMPNVTACHDELYCTAPTELLLVRAQCCYSKILTMVKVWRQCYQTLAVCRNPKPNVVF